MDFEPTPKIEAIGIFEILYEHSSVTNGFDWLRAGRYEVDGYIYNAAEEPKILMTGKWNEAMSYQPCDLEGEPLPGTEMKEVS